jgi:dihydroorotase
VLIRGARLVDPTLSIDALRDVRADAVVLEIAEHLDALPNEEIFDAQGLTLAPGFIDMHVHLRDPGEPQKETLETGGAAALRGGFTSIACMPNTNPPLDDPGIIEDVVRRALAIERPMPRIYPIGAITRGRNGKELCDYAALAQAGAVAFSDDGSSVADRRVLANAATAAKELRAPFIEHCENSGLAKISSALSESSVVARDLHIAEQSGKSWHLAHLSTRTAVELLRFAHTSGIRVSAEATPHHLLCTAESTRWMEGSARVNPPLGSEDDVRALKDAVREGTIEVLASDHAPHTVEEKRGASPPPGFSGLEVAVGAYAAALPDVPVSQFVSLLSCAPARILGLSGGSIGIGRPADFTFFVDRPWRVDSRSFASKGKVTPFDGMTLPRQVIATMVAGKVAYDARVAVSR